MSEDFDPDAAPCPICQEGCEWIGPGVWFCEACAQPWTASEVAERPEFPEERFET